MVGWFSRSHWSHGEKESVRLSQFIRGSAPINDPCPFPLELDSLGELNPGKREPFPKSPRDKRQRSHKIVNNYPYGCGSKLNRRGYAGVGPCFHLPGFHFGTGCLSHSHI